MNKKTKLKICDWALLVSTILILASGVQLEVIHGDPFGFIWLHITLGIIFFILCAWHVFLHFGRSNWFDRFHKLKNQPTRILWWAGILTLASALLATVHFIVNPIHSPIGGIHGKLGFLMMIFAVFHIAKRLRFFKS